MKQNTDQEKDLHIIYDKSAVTKAQKGLEVRVSDKMPLQHAKGPGMDPQHHKMNE
jgi:hypothetical protein